MTLDSKYASYLKVVRISLSIKLVSFHLNILKQRLGFGSLVKLKVFFYFGLELHGLFWPIEPLLPSHFEFFGLRPSYVPKKKN